MNLKIKFLIFSLFHILIFANLYSIKLNDYIIDDLCFDNINNKLKSDKNNTFPKQIEFIKKLIIGDEEEGHLQFYLVDSTLNFLFDVDSNSFYIKNSSTNINLPLEPLINEIKICKDKLDVHLIREINFLVKWNEVKFFFLKNNQISYLIVTSPINGSSGLSTNYYTWLIINLDNGKYINFFSSSNNPNFIFYKESLMFYEFGLNFKTRFSKIKLFDYQLYSLNENKGCKKLKSGTIKCK